MPEKEAVWRGAERIDVHNHVWRAGRGQVDGPSGGLDVGRAERLLAKGEKLGIDCFCVSTPLTGDAPTPEDIVNQVCIPAKPTSSQLSDDSCVSKCR